MQEIDKNGMRIYVFDSPKKVPNIKELIRNPERNIKFIKSCTLNPKDKNAKLYSYFSSDTYRSFLYAFTYQLGILPLSSSVRSQFEMNARRFERLCKKREIVLSELEISIVEKCKNFHDLDLGNKAKAELSKRLLSELIECYY